jgi:Holliday junction resolvase
MNVLYLWTLGACDGMKVAVEIRIMKADDLYLFDNDLGALAHFVEEYLDR